MKKLIIVLAVGMITAESFAQSGKKMVPPPPPPHPQEMKDVPTPPPPPPPPPKKMEEAAPANVPEIRKVPPPPPKPPVVSKVKFASPNEKGYAIAVRQTNEESVILLTKNGMTQKIRMSVWNAKPEYFEHKYGKLPPPPPPPPTPPIKE